MGATIIEVGFSDDDGARRAEVALCKIGLCDVEAMSHVVQLKVDDGTRVVLDVVRTLDAEHLEPVSLNVREPTLDDVFLTITGHAAEETDGEDAPAETQGRKERGAA